MQQVRATVKVALAVSRHFSGHFALFSAGFTGAKKRARTAPLFSVGALREKNLMVAQQRVLLPWGIAMSTCIKGANAPVQRGRVRNVDER